MRVQFCGRSRAVEVGLIVQLFKLFQRCARSLGQTHHDRLSLFVVTDWQASSCALLGCLEQIEDLVVVDFVIAHGHLDGGFASAVFLNFTRSAVDAGKKSRDDTAILQRLSTAHSVRLTSARDTVCEDGDIEALEQVFDSR